MRDPSLSRKLRLYLDFTCATGINRCLAKLNISKVLDACSKAKTTLSVGVASHYLSHAPLVQFVLRV